MIIVKLEGGLGNQMFQYARGLAESVDKKTSLALDISEYSRNTKREFTLGHYSISVRVASSFEILIQKVFRRSNYLVGYFQSEKYFKNISDQVKKEFTLKEPIDHVLPNIAEDIKTSQSVSVHIRRTDYLDKQHRYIILGKDYYSSAMEIIQSKVPSPKFFFFSDDIEWVKQNLNFPSDSIFMNYKDYEELALMSLCKHNIIANSTFSWWGAWLNTNMAKIVISPKKWFTTYEYEEGFLPQSWITI